MAIQLADFSGGDIYKEDPATHRFFVRNSKAPEGGRWTVSTFGTIPSLTSNELMPFNSLFPMRPHMFICTVCLSNSYTSQCQLMNLDNLLQPSRFPVSGKGGSIAKRITYRCGDMDFIPPSTTGCAGGKV